MNAQYENISIEEVIARTKVQLNLTHGSDYDDALSIFIYEGLSSLGVLSQLSKKQCSLSITNGMAQLPHGFVKLIAVRADIINDTNDPTANNTQCQYILYADQMFLNNCGCNETAQSFQINNGFIHFNSSAQFANAQIAYFGLNVDEDGRHLIYSKYERALMNYACWMFALNHFDKYHQYIISTYESIWVAQKAKIKADDVRDNFELNKRDIQTILSALVTSRSVNF